MKTLIQAAEIWVLDADGYLLELADGLYGSAVEFGALSKAMCFGRGEGLPGRVWEEGRPILLKDLQGGYFRRAKAAKAAGLTCAVGIPVYFGGALKAVIVFLCGGGNWGAGAIELWRHRAGEGDEMALVDGYYGSTDEGFEANARDTTMAKGAGLVGAAWEGNEAVFINELSSSSRFLRGGAALSAGLRHGLAIPFDTLANESFVVTFLSSVATPIVSRIESWLASADTDALHRGFGYCEIDGELSNGADVVTPGIGEDAIAAAFASAVPRVLKRSASDPDAMGETDALVAVGGVLAIPVVRNSTVAEAIALYI